MPPSTVTVQCPVCPSYVQPAATVPFGGQAEAVRCKNCGGFFRAPADVKAGDLVLGLPTDADGKFLPPPPPRSHSRGILVQCPICPPECQAAVKKRFEDRAEASRCKNCGNYFRAPDGTPDGDSVMGLPSDAEGRLRTRVDRPRPVGVSVLCPLCPRETQTPVRLPFKYRHDVVKCKNCGTFFRFLEKRPEDFADYDAYERYMNMVQYFEDGIDVKGVATTEAGTPLPEKPRHNPLSTW